ncbi:MAG: lysophospholipid acyltransferase family protein [Gulosibacter sp.]|uniref:lysophospholipid acyltransferase family protein n=1 Tax=Gulosibacter sp. TaxID=2817531 RepID=UPI003F91042F
MFYWLLKHLVAGPVARRLFRPVVEGAENIPDEGAVILASNHLSVIDSFILPLVIKRRVNFLAKSEYFTGKGVKGLLSRWFFTSTGMIPMDRSGGKASESSLRTGLEVLERQGCLGIYPEGTRSPDARLYRGRTGIARMILEADTNVVVVPVVMVDTEKIMPIGAKRPKAGRIGIKLGEPLDFSRYRGMHSSRFILRSVTDEIMTEIAGLSDQDYADVYASKLRNASPALTQ